MPRRIVTYYPIIESNLSYWNNKKASRLREKDYAVGISFKDVLGIGIHYGIVLSAYFFNKTHIYMLLKLVQQETIKEKKRNALTLQMDPVNFLLPRYSYPKPVEVCLLVYL